MTIKLPEEMPLMTLADTVLFPQTIMPLYIFEKRYQQMLSDALSEDRVFAIANRACSNPDIETPQSIATAGIIRVSTMNPDGTSTVALQGSERIRITKIVSREPYMVVKAIAEPTTGDSLSTEEHTHYQKRLLALVDSLIKLGGHTSDEFYLACKDLDDVESLSYFMLQAYCDNANTRQELLETLDIRERIAKVIQFFQAEVTNMTLNRELSENFPVDFEPDN